MFQTKCVEKLITLISCLITFFFENRVVYEIMCKSSVESGRPLIAIWCMGTVCWTKVTNTHSEYTIVTAFPLHQ